MELVIILAAAVIGKTIYGKSYDSDTAEDTVIIDYNYFEFYNNGEKEFNSNIDMLYPEEKDHYRGYYEENHFFQKRMIEKDDNDLGDYFYDSTKEPLETEKPFRPVEYKSDQDEENDITHRKKYYDSDVPSEIMQIKEQKRQEIASGLYFDDADGRLVLDFFEYERE